MSINKLKLSPHQCIVVEDSVQGVRAGKAAGCRVVALEGSVDRNLLMNADYIISHLSDIQNIL